KTVRTSRAKAKIRAYIKQQERDRACELGREILEKTLRKFSLNFNRIEKGGKLKPVIEKLYYKTTDEMLAAIGYGRTTPEDVAKLLVPKEDFEKFLEAEQSPKKEDSFLKKVFKSAAQRSDAKNAISVANL